MSEASDKRLGTIRDVHEKRIKQNEFYSARFLDVEWLIEQAERAQELSAWQETARNYFGENVSLKAENKRLREALEKIAFVYEDTKELAYDQRGMYIIARQALEVERCD